MSTHVPTSPTATAHESALAAAEDALLATTGLAVERQTLHAGELRLHYLACGAGEPLVLLHGRGTGGALFAPMLAQLAQLRRVYALDLPGWGLSEKPPFAGRTPEDALAVWVGGTRAFLDALGLEQVELLGHSLGGLVALAYALEQPQRVRRLALVAAAGLGSQAQLDMRLYFRLKPERIHRWLGLGFSRWALRRDLHGRGAFSPELLAYYHAVTAQADVIPSGGRAFDRVANLSGMHVDLRKRLRELEMPILLAWGDRDVVVPYATALRARRYLPTAHLVAFTGCGHLPFVERPADFARVLGTWLEGGRVASRV